MGDAAAFISQGIGNAKKAISADRAGNFQEALKFYDETLKSLEQAIACDTNAQRIQVTKKKASEYQTRREQLRSRMAKSAPSGGGTVRQPSGGQQQAKTAQPSNYHAVPLKSNADDIKILCLWVTDNANHAFVDRLRAEGMQFLLTTTFAEGMQVLRKNTEITHVINNVHRAGGKLAATHELIDLVQKYEPNLPIVLTTFEMDTSNPKKFQKKLQEIQLDLQGCMRMGARAIANSVDELAVILKDPAHWPDRSLVRGFDSAAARPRQQKGRSVFNQKGLEYFVADVVGAGNFGVIHNVTDCFGQDYVTKILKSNRSAEEVQADWAKEVQFLYTLNHPNIIQLYDAFQYENVHYLIMERASGTLREYVAQYGTMNDKDVVSTGGQILSGLHHIHQRNIIHRDLHVDNILYAPPRSPNQKLCVKITDFGISKLLKPTENAAVTFIGRDYDYCLDEKMEVLTSEGFLDLDQFLSKRDADEQLLVAAYQPDSRTIVYQPFEMVGPHPRRHQQMIEFSDPRELEHTWSRAAGDYPARLSGERGDCCQFTSNGINLLVTPEHEMWVNCDPGSPVPASSFSKQRADALHSTSLQTIRFQAAAEHGFISNSSGARPPQFAVRLGLSTPAQSNAFLYVYGAWLKFGCGRLSWHLQPSGSSGGDLISVCTGVDFIISHGAACDELLEMLRLTGLSVERGQVVVLPQSSIISVVDSRWTAYFSEQYEQSSDQREAPSVVQAERDGVLSLSSNNVDDSEDETTEDSLNSSLSVSNDFAYDDSSARTGAPQDHYFVPNKIDHDQGDTDDTPTGKKHQQWVWDWVWNCGRDELRCIIDGLEHGSKRDSDGPMDDVDCVFRAHSFVFRDELVRLLLLAGYSAHFESDGPKEHWVYCCKSPGANGSGETPNQWRWTLNPSKQPNCVRQVAYTGRTWCVRLPSGLIFVRRAHKNRHGQVTKASRPMIVSNCPELITKGHTTKRSDVYQVGLVLYHLYTGNHALSAEDGINVVQIVTSGLARTRAEQLKTKLGDVIGIMLRRAPEYRYKDCVEAWSHLSGAV